MHSVKENNILKYIFIILEIILCILVQITNNIANTIVSYTAIVLAFIYVLINFNRRKSYILTLFGLLFTLFADLFLVVLTPRMEIPAMFFFSLTQICYFIILFLNHNSSKEKVIHLIIRIVTIIVAISLTIIVLKDKTDFLSIISLFYYSNLIINTIFSFAKFNTNKLLAFGLLCFTLCDLFIGLSILEETYISINENSFLYLLCHPGFNIAWIFYIPSQTLISLSINKRALETI